VIGTRNIEVLEYDYTVVYIYIYNGELDDWSQQPRSGRNLNMQTNVGIRRVRSGRASRKKRDEYIEVLHELRRGWPSRRLNMPTPIH